MRPQTVGGAFWACLLVLLTILPAAGPAQASEWLQDGICRNWGVTPQLFQFGVPAAERWSAVAVAPMIVGDVDGSDLARWTGTHLATDLSDVALGFGRVGCE